MAIFGLHMPDTLKEEIDELRGSESRSSFIARKLTEILGTDKRRRKRTLQESMRNQHGNAAIIAIALIVVAGLLLLAFVTGLVRLPISIGNQPTCTASGTVTEWDGGAPITGATLRLYEGRSRLNWYATTGGDGAYSVSAPCGTSSGPFEVFASKDGYFPSSNDGLPFASGGTVETIVNFQLLRIP